MKKEQLIARLKYIEKATQTSNILKSRISELQDTKRVTDNTIKKTKQEITNEMLENGVIQETIDNYKITIKKTKPIVIIDCDTEELPSTCIKVKTEPDKVKILEELNKGEVAHGCNLQDNYSFNLSYLDNKK